MEKYKGKDIKCKQSDSYYDETITTERILSKVIRVGKDNQVYSIIFWKRLLTSNYNGDNIKKNVDFEYLTMSIIDEYNVLLVVANYKCDEMKLNALILKNEEDLIKFMVRECGYSTTERRILRILGYDD